MACAASAASSKSSGWTAASCRRRSCSAYAPVGGHEACGQVPAFFEQLRAPGWHCDTRLFLIHPDAERRAVLLAVMRRPGGDGRSAGGSVAAALRCAPGRAASPIPARDRRTAAAGVVPVRGFAPVRGRAGRGRDWGGRCASPSWPAVGCWAAPRGAATLLVPAALARRLRRRRRHRRLLYQLPDCLDLLAASLRSGLGLAARPAAPGGPPAAARWRRNWPS